MLIACLCLHVFHSWLSRVWPVPRVIIPRVTIPHVIIPPVTIHTWHSMNYMRRVHSTPQENMVHTATLRDYLNILRVYMHVK